MVHKLVEGMDSRELRSLEEVDRIIAARKTVANHIQHGLKPHPYTQADHENDADGLRLVNEEIRMLVAERAEILSSSAEAAAPPNNSPTEERSLREALTQIIAIKDDTLGVREGGENEKTRAFDRGCRMAFYRCAEIARTALSKQGDGK